MNPVPRWLIVGATIVAIVAIVAPFSGCVIPGMGEMDPSAGINGSFEIEQSGLPVNWFIGRHAIQNGDAEISLDTSDAVHGAQSLQFIVHRVDDGPQKAPWLFRSGAAQAGATYAVSFWLKSTACVVQMEIRNEGKDRMFGLSEEEKQDYAAHPPVRRTIGGGETGTDEWRQFRYVYKVPETDGSLRFELRIMRPCTLWIDDLRIEAAEGEPASMPQPGF